MAPRNRLRGAVSSRLMLRWLTTVVVSDEEKAHGMRQAGTRKTTTAEASKLFQMTSEPECWCVLRDEPGGCPVYWPGGVRRRGGVSLVCGCRAEREKACPETAASACGERECPSRECPVGT